MRAPEEGGLVKAEGERLLFLGLGSPMEMQEKKEVGVICCGWVIIVPVLGMECQQGALVGKGRRGGERPR